MWEAIISTLTGLCAIGITALCNFIKSKLSIKFQERVEKIAAVVEQLYSGCASAEKLAAFKDLCKAKGLPIGKAVEYLEMHIIPLSNEINAYKAADNVKPDTNNTGVTN